MPIAQRALALLVVASVIEACGSSGHDGPPRDDAATPAEDAGAPDAGPVVEADIREALDCGDPLGIGGAGAPGELELHRIDTATFPDALCNDGTPAILYYRPYRGEENRDRWVISMRGGGSCSSPESCAARWCSCEPDETSDRCPATDIETHFDLNNMSGGGRRGADPGGILRRDGGPNPLEDYNHVQLVYCSSDQWVGNARGVRFTTVHPRTGAEVSYTLHFLGARILEADLRVLRRDGAAPLVYTLDGGAVEMPDLDEATNVVLAGDSAGGAGVIAQLDHVAEMLRAEHVGAGVPEVVGLIDAITGPELRRLDFGAGPPELDTYEEVIAAIASGPVNAGGFRDQSCEEWHRAHEPETIDSCVDDTHVIRNHVTTPFFVRMALLDTLISSNYEASGLADPDLGPFVRTEISPGVMVPLTFATVLRRELAAFPMLPGDAEEGDAMERAPGVFAPACSNHDTIHTDSEVYGVTIRPADTTTDLHLFDVMGRWYTGVGEPTALLTSDPMRMDTYCP